MKLIEAYELTIGYTMKMRRKGFGVAFRTSFIPGYNKREWIEDAYHSSTLLSTDQSDPIYLWAWEFLRFLASRRASLKVAKGLKGELSIVYGVLPTVLDRAIYFSYSFEIFVIDLKPLPTEKWFEQCHLNFFKLPSWRKLSRQSLFEVSRYKILKCFVKLEEQTSIGRVSTYLSNGNAWSRDDFENPFQIYSRLDQAWLCNTRRKHLRRRNQTGNRNTYIQL